MGWYQDVIGAEVAPRQPTVVVTTQAAGDTFWTAVKWMGAALVLVTAYREASTFYREKLRKDDAEEKEED